MKYQNFETLKKNSEFKSVYQAKHSYANKYIIMYILQNGTDTNRLGVSVSKSREQYCPAQAGKAYTRSIPVKCYTGSTRI